MAARRSWWRSTTDASPDGEPPALADALTDLAIVIDQLLVRDKRGELGGLLVVVEEAYVSGTNDQRALALSRGLGSRLRPHRRLPVAAHAYDLDQLAAWADVVRA